MPPPQTPHSAPAEPHAIGGGPCTSGYAFGLSLLMEFPVAGLDARASFDGSEAIRLRLREDHDPDPWRDGRARALVGRRTADGRVVMSVHSHPEHGHRVFAEGYGTFVLSAAGDTLDCTPAAGVESWRWQRFLIAQVLPLVAVLAGHEVLHASAVALDGRVLALVGGTGAGKTTLALHLARAGARLFADDALTLELSDAKLVAHPGAGIANVCPAEHQRLVRAAGAPVGTIVGADDEGLRLVVSSETRSMPLGAVYFVNRGASGDGVAFAPADGARVLGATFNVSVRNPGRLRTHLEISAALARSVSCHRVDAPPGMGAADLAAAIARDARAG